MQRPRGGKELELTQGELQCQGAGKGNKGTMAAGEVSGTEGRGHCGPWGAVWMTF